MSFDDLQGFSGLVPSAFRLDEPGQGTLPAIDLASFFLAALLSPDSRLYNVEHEHLLTAKIGFLFTDTPATRKGKHIMGQAEMPSQMSGSPWAKARALQQYCDWFGEPQDFIITLYAPYVLQAAPIEQMALLEHELYHCGHVHDSQGIPKFKQDGSPVFGIRGHDVEEFVGVARRYGISAGEGRALAEALLSGPELSPVTVSAVCATCIR